MAIALRATQPRHLNSLLKNLLQSVGTPNIPRNSKESCGLMFNNHKELSISHAFSGLDRKKATICQSLLLRKRWVERPKCKKLVGKGPTES